MRRNRIQDYHRTMISMLNIVDDNIQQQRLDICKSCDNFTSLKFCNVCNCNMPVKIKFKNVKCPIDKWTTQA